MFFLKMMEGSCRGKNGCVCVCVVCKVCRLRMLHWFSPPPPFPSAPPPSIPVSLPPVFLPSFPFAGSPSSCLTRRDGSLIEGSLLFAGLPSSPSYSRILSFRPTHTDTHPLQLPASFLPPSFSTMLAIIIACNAPNHIGLLLFCSSFLLESTKRVMLEMHTSATDSG